MNQERVNAIGFYATLLALLLFALGRLFGADIFGNHYSFSHWRYLPTWYGWSWLIVTGLVAMVALKFKDTLAAVSPTCTQMFMALGCLGLVLIVFRFDSPLYGGGNLRIAQVAQADRVIFRWFELGSIGLTAALTQIIEFIGWRDIHAGGLAWRLFSFGCTLGSIIAAIKISHLLSEHALRRIVYFIILFFGPQTILHFGFIGLEPVVVTGTLWFGLLALRLHRRPSLIQFMYLWGVVLLGMVMHISLAFLLPAAAYLSVAVGTPREQRPYAAGFVAGTIYLALLWALYSQTGDSLELSRLLLFSSGKLPFADYGLLDSRRISDLVQLLFLLAPLLLAAKVISFLNRGWLQGNHPLMAAWWMSLGSATIIFIIDPINSVVIDLPRLAAYLAPFSLFIAFMLASLTIDHTRNHRTLLLVAVSSFMVPVSYLPSYLCTEKAEAYVAEYFESQPTFYRIGTVMLRDAYFYLGDLDQANRWDQAQPIKSRDFLEYRGLIDLSRANEDRVAAQELMRLKARHPYWTELHALMAELRLKLGQFGAARRQIDTCLMLEPYNKAHYLNLAKYWRTAGQNDSALAAQEVAAHLAPSDVEIQIDIMFLKHNMGRTEEAELIADELLTDDSALAHPYWIKGAQWEREGDLRRAATSYKRFIDLAPDDPEAQTAIDHLSKLLADIKRR